MPTRRSFIIQSAATGVLAAANVPTIESTTAAPISPIHTLTMPSTDLVVSRIAFGAGVLKPDSHGHRMLRTLYDNGITFFDHADFYGEAAFGELLQQSPGLRHKIAIQTKCGLRRGQRQQIFRDCSRENIVSAVEGSLRLMNTDHIDILLLHWPDALAKPHDIASAFDELARAGKVRYFGVSNHTPLQIEHLKRYVEQPLVANQIYLSLESSYLIMGRNDALEERATPGALDYCHMHQIQVQAWSPIRGGLLRPAADATPAMKHGAEVVAAMAKDKNVSPAAISLAWLLHHPAQIIPIMSTRNPEHVLENCAAERVSLTREEWYTLLDATLPIHSPRDA